MLSHILGGTAMVRSLLRVVLVLIVVAAIAAFFVGYRYANRDRVNPPEYATGTSGTTTTGTVNIDRAREAGATIGAKVAEGANKAEQLTRDGAITAKIRSKMALDDTINALHINVDTSGETVTLKGTVRSQHDRERAVQLARETDGVTSVVDQLTIAN